jgi:hypothetical protein
LKTEALAIHACQSAGIFAERICNAGFPAPKEASGVEAAECFIVHNLVDDNSGELTEELKRNLILR